jgi:hypothetical protein
MLLKSRIIAALALASLLVSPIVGFEVAHAEIIPSPNITSVSPAQGNSNTSVTINGANFSGASSVQFYTLNGQIAGSLTPSSVSDTSVVFIMGGVFVANTALGPYRIKVVTPAGTSNGESFTITNPLTNAPTITSITPSQGSVNTLMTIYGTNLSGATEINFYNSNNQLIASVSNSAQTNFTISSSGEILFTLYGALAYNADGSSQVQVVTPAGSSNEFPFAVLTPSANIPNITSVIPALGDLNAIVTIYGANLAGASSVQFYTSNGQIAGSLTPSSVSNTSIIFTMGGVFVANTAPGPYQIKVVTPAGTSNGQSFTITNSVATQTPVGPAPITVPISTPIPISKPTSPAVTGSGSSNSSTQALQLQLTQLISLLLQLLEQAAARGLLSPSQLSSALNAVSR